MLCGLRDVYKAFQIDQRRRSLLQMSMLPTLEIAIGHKQKRKIKGFKSVKVNHLNIFKDLG